MAPAGQGRGEEPLDEDLRLAGDREDDDGRDEREDEGPGRRYAAPVAVRRRCAAPVLRPRRCAAPPVPGRRCAADVLRARRCAALVPGRGGLVPARPQPPYQRRPLDERHEHPADRDAGGRRPYAPAGAEQDDGGDDSDVVGDVDGGRCEEAAVGAQGRR